MTSPRATLMAAAMAKSMNMPSCVMIEHSIGMTKVMAKNAIIRPKT